MSEAIGLTAKRLRRAERAVLFALNNPAGTYYGRYIARRVRLMGGPRIFSIYATLARLESVGFVDRSSETPAAPGLLPRSAYRITQDGVDATLHLLDDLA